MVDAYDCKVHIRLLLKRNAINHMICIQPNIMSNQIDISYNYSLFIPGPFQFMARHQRLISTDLLHIAHL